jgi:hypothetical protein
MCYILREFFQSLVFLFGVGASKMIGDGDVV